MSTTSHMIHNTNAACCSIPPVQSQYTPKGTFKSVGDFKKVYVTGGPSDNAIVCVYDIFGYFPQTQQGADIIASALKTVVYMPDFFEPNAPFPAENFPPTTDEGKKALQDFFGGTANPQANVKKLVAFGQTLKSGGAKKLGAYGFCWGGKVTLSAAGEATPFESVSIIHPAMLSVDDANKLTILDVIAKKPFATKNDNKYFANMFHGWAAARADLKNQDNKEEFENLYTRLAEFFSKTL
ncbi:hypothetical protein B0H11DRAFT_95314 [Mycena galericulata]|nr:hypothetical protein B0H11DRAFT_95314 [Mycena galericulata]